jgi:hypothetical protein
MRHLHTVWDKINLSPRAMRHLNGWIIVFLIPWTILMLPGLPLIGLGQEVWYVTFVSHLALILAALGAFVAARVEVRQEEDEE